MELKEFIEKTLVDIMSAVDSANTKLPGRPYNDRTEGIKYLSRIILTGCEINFDIAVTVDNSQIDKTTGSGGASISVIEAKINSEDTSSLSYKNSSRISFNVRMDDK